MPSPFPGMDPYLEDNNIWPSFHQRLAVEIADRLSALIGPRYFADVNVRTVQIYQADTGELVTSVEILSPYDKRAGQGLEEYRPKRTRIILSPVHLVEVDLLRAGERPGREVNEPPLDAEYILLVNRNRYGDIRISEFWPGAFNERLPLIPIPLLPPDSDVALDLTTAIQTIYARAAYDRRLDYRRPVPPPELRPAMAAWVKERLPEVA